MLDIKWIRNNPNALDKGLKLRGLPAREEEILRLYDEWRTRVTVVEKLQASRKQRAKEIGALKARGEDISTHPHLLRRDEILTDEERDTEVAYEKLNAALEALPNIPADDVPEGSDSSFNLEQLRSDVPKRPSFGFKPKDHAALGEAANRRKRLSQVLAGKSCVFSQP